ncbi:MAG: heparan-alpha-glucosaminide N-acetyltransferase domain-containing protein [Arcanobacterium sp.]|nr:heparan-alpha-glucosaminide N-acetyltransferase domain-containing protein [Arcanobacterium sp.]
MSTETIGSQTTLNTVTRYSGRLVALDIARGFAIIGMIWAHTALFIPETKIGEIFGQIPHGRSALLFTFLAGISISIITGRNKAYTGAVMNSARLRIVGRAIGLLFITMLLFTFDHPISVILGYYALWFLISILFVNLSAKTLLISGFTLGILGPVAVQFLTSLEMSLGWFSSADGPNAMMNTGLFSGVYPGLAYMSPVLVGMGIGRLDLSSSKLHKKMLIGGVLLATLAYLASWGATHSFAKPDFPYEDLNSSISSSSSTDGEISSGLGDINNGSFYDETLDTSALISTKEEIKSTLNHKVSTIQKLIDAQETITLSELQNKLFLGASFDSTDSSMNWEEENQKFIPPTLNSLFDASAHTNSSFEILGSIGVSLALVGLLFLGQKFFRYALYPIAALGSMALTAYVAHVVFIGYGPEWISSENLNGFTLVSLSILAFCSLWRLALKKGPLEFLLSKFADFVGKSPENSEASKATSENSEILKSTPEIKVEVLTQN